ncbi:retrovirus-related pol polyprotein LINE-1 [Tanacetum coccineum]
MTSIRGILKSNRFKKLEDLHTDMAIEGYVKNMTPKGCFIMLSLKLDAKILISNLSDYSVSKFEEEFPIGNFIEVSLHKTSGTKESNYDVSNFGSLRAGEIISGRGFDFLFDAYFGLSTYSGRELQHHINFKHVLKMKQKNLTCAPTNVAIVQLASRVLSLVKESYETTTASGDCFCSVGDVVLFGNMERLKFSSDIEEIYLDHRVKRLAECLGPVTGERTILELRSFVEFVQERLRETLEDNDIKVSREKTEYLRRDFGNVAIAHNEEVNICIRDNILQPKESFRYLGLMIHKSGRIGEDVSHRIKATWLKWRAVTGVMCDRSVPLKLKRKLYRVAIRAFMLYGSE